MKRFLIVAVAMIATIFVACNGLDDGTKVIEFTDGTQKTQIFYANEHGGTIKFRAADEWYIVIDEVSRTEPSWLTIDKTNGEAGECEITITLDENTTGEERKAEIRIICGDTVITVTITQKPTKRDDGEENPMPAIGKRIIKAVKYERDSMYDNDPIAASFTFKYDNDGRISGFESTYKGSWSGYDPISNFSIGYEAEAIWYEYIDLKRIWENDEWTKGFDYRCEAVLDKRNRVVEWRYYTNNEDINGVSPSPGPVPEAQNAEKLDLRRSQTLSYNIAGYLVKCVQTYLSNNVKSSETTYSLEWTNGNCTKITKNREESSSDVCMEYSDYPMLTNIDINWLLYHYIYYQSGDDGICADVAAGNNGKHIFMMQGYCGKRNKNLVSVYNSDDYNDCYYTYSFDDEGYPTKIEQRRKNDNIMDFYWIIEYDK